MSATIEYPFARPGVLPDSVNARQHLRNLAEAANDLLDGHGNCTLKLTLAPNSGSSVVKDGRISIQTCPLFAPLTANAAAEWASGQMFASCVKGLLTITHRNSPETDRTFMVALVG